MTFSPLLICIVNTGASGHTNFAGAISCNAALSTPDVVVDYMLSATDLAGNRGFSDYVTSDTDTAGVKDSYTFNIDELKPSLDSANRELVYNFLKSFKDMTLIIISHNEDTIRKMCTQYAVMEKGRLSRLYSI